MPGLTCHSDAGSQFTSIRYGERLAEIGAVHRSAHLGQRRRDNPWSKSNGPSLRKNQRDSVAVNDNVHCGVVGRWLLPHRVLQPLTLNLR